MSTLALKVNTTQYDFVDKCVITINDTGNTLEIQISDTSITELQNTYNELIVATTIAEIGIFNSGNFSDATLKYTSKTIQPSNTNLTTRQASTGTNYRLFFSVDL